MPVFMRVSNIFLTVDIVLLKRVKNDVFLLLIQRKNNPFQYSWALPGGYVNQNENPDDAALRELYEETHVQASLSQLKVFGKFGRDPRGHLISAAYFGWVDSSTEARADDDAQDAQWFNIQELPQLAFDHDEIIAFALQNNNIKNEISH
jgi:8-oxo-dGTP diphosphatase